MYKRQLKHLAESGALQKDELVVAYITGNGLKTQEAVEQVVNPLEVRPMLSSFEEALRERTLAKR